MRFINLQAKLNYLFRPQTNKILPTKLLSDEEQDWNINLDFSG